ncbi:unnamed protein product [Sphenostylis stenocarpa]|uniref:Uncharacterized protein n=1 Tax=Sphenostylis stenocarpa TaxID=92480 RepID=A0AA86SJC7_9FABA|nr:unnamed protein product [Sphenostylis stenocarpa]
MTRFSREALRRRMKVKTIKSKDKKKEQDKTYTESGRTDDGGWIGRVKGGEIEREVFVK